MVAVRVKDISYCWWCDGQNCAKTYKVDGTVVRVSKCKPILFKAIIAKNEFCSPLEWTKDKTPAKCEECELITDVMTYDDVYQECELRICYECSKDWEPLPICQFCSELGLDEFKTSNGVNLPICEGCLEELDEDDIIALKVR